MKKKKKKKRREEKKKGREKGELDRRGHKPGVEARWRRGGGRAAAMIGELLRPSAIGRRSAELLSLSLSLFPFLLSSLFLPLSLSPSPSFPPLFSLFPSVSIFGGFGGELIRAPKFYPKKNPYITAYPTPSSPLPQPTLFPLTPLPLLRQCFLLLRRCSPSP
ncbi:unnamed protein product [Camellia sinensis]